VSEDAPAPEPRGRFAGGCLLTVAALGTGWAIFSVSRNVFVLLVWGVGAFLIWRAAKKVPGATNPAPPPPSERGSEKEPQVTMVRDTAHPNRWVVARESPWVATTIDKEAESNEWTSP